MVLRIGIAWYMQKRRVLGLLNGSASWHEQSMVYWDWDWDCLYQEQRTSYSA